MLGIGGDRNGTRALGAVLGAVHVLQATIQFLLIFGREILYESAAVVAVSSLMRARRRSRAKPDCISFPLL